MSIIQIGTRSFGSSFFLLKTRGIRQMPEQTATNVTTNINGKAISSIFEANGTTVKSATNAVKATTATNIDDGTL